ncbi:MAG: hypothetical protein ACRECT_01355 [Thermoplasmata archaeon]
MGENPDVWPEGSSRNANAGWIAGLIIVIAVFVIGGAFWFSYHP